MSTTQAGLDAAYATEINNCEFRADAGPKKQARPAEFCQSVTVQGSTTLAGATTAQGPMAVQGTMEVQGSAAFVSPIKVQGKIFLPTPLFGAIVLASGPLAPTPPASVFDNITVNGTATIANAIMDSGFY